MHWLEVATTVTCIVSAMLSLTLLAYTCNGVWGLWMRLKRVETSLLDADSKIIAMVATLDSGLAARRAALQNPDKPR